MCMQVVRLTREMEALRTERDVAALSAVPATDSSDIVSLAINISAAVTSELEH